MGSPASVPTSIVVSDSGDPDESPVFRHGLTVVENGGRLISTFRSCPSVVTTSDLMEVASVKYRDLRAFGERAVFPDGHFGPYQWITFREFFEKTLRFSRGLLALGLSSGDRIGIYTVNCTWWQVTAYAAQYAGIIPVPIYDSLGPGSAEYIISHSECKAVVVSRAKLSSLRAALGTVKTVLVIDAFETSVEGDVAFRSCDSVLSDDTSIVPTHPRADDLAIIMYTSGSTGNPKGCMLTHRNLIAGSVGLGCPGCSITKTDTFFSLLPLAHVYEMGAELLMMAQGTAVGFFSGNTKLMTDDLQALQPTIICGVPRLWNRIADAMRAKIAARSPLTRTLINLALKFKRRQVYAKQPTSLLIDTLIFSPFRQVIGGRVRLIVSGGAPILPDIYDFLIAAISPNIVQGYGLTEVAASVAVSEIPQLSPCDNGPVSLTSDLKLRRVEGLDYNPRGSPMCGEVLVKGPHIFKGYYKAENLTAQALDSDGWYATGDIGLLTPSGYLQIIDRVKQLVKLSQGEYISISSLNDIYGTTTELKNVYVFADSHHDAPAAVVVPGDQLVDEWKKQGIEQFIGNSIAEEKVLSLLRKTAEAQKLRGFERIAAVLLDDEEFTVENGLLTPSLKPQWPSLRKKYETQLLNLYHR